MTARLLALGLAGLAALAFVADGTPAPTVLPGEAAQWEGQAVAVRGVVRDLRVAEGVARFDLVQAGAAVAVRAESKPPPEGAAVEAHGRLARIGGTLTLVAQGIGPHAFDAGLPVSVAALAQDPSTWHDHAVEVTGTVDHGRLKGDGHSIALGSGDWPPEGALTATVLLRYDAACACHRVDRVAPWTP